MPSRAYYWPTFFGEMEAPPSPGAVATYADTHIFDTEKNSSSKRGNIYHAPSRSDGTRSAEAVMAFFAPRRDSRIGIGALPPWRY